MDKEISNTLYAEYRGHENNCICCIVYLGNSKSKKSSKFKADLKLDTNNSILMQKVSTLKLRDKFYIDVRYPKGYGYYNEKTWIVTDLLDEFDMVEKSNKANHLFDSPINIKKKTSFFEPKRMSRNYSAKDIEIQELKELNSNLKDENKGLNELISRLYKEISKLKEQIKLLGGE